MFDDRWWHGLENHCRYEFLLVVLDFFFTLLYYSYETRLQIFEKLRPSIFKLDHYW